MVGMIAMAGVAFVWLWLFAPDNVSEGLRKTLLLLSAGVFFLSCWSTASLMEAHRQARQTAKMRLQQVDRERRESAELIRRDNEDLGYSQPAQ